MEKKPIRPDKVWHLKKEFVDVNGDIYAKGVFTGKQLEPSNEDIDWLVKNGYDSYGNELSLPPKLETIKSEVVKEKEVVVIEKETKKDVSVSNEEFADLKTKFEQLQELTNKLLLKENDGKPIYVKLEDENKYGILKPKSIPKDDFQQERVTFYTQGGGSLLPFYKLNEEMMYPPYGQPIQFKKWHTQTRQNGKHEEHVHISRYETNSKKEMEYIRNYPLFGKIIWENAKEAINHSSEMFIKLKNIASTVYNLNGDKLYTTAMAHRINIVGRTTEEIRSEIILCCIAEIQKKETEIQNQILSKNSEQKLFA